MKNEKNAAIEIRVPKTFESQAIADLIYDSFVGYKSLYTKNGFTATTVSVQEIEKRIYRKIIWIAVCNELVAGTISLFPGTEEILIKSVAVTPTARGKGIGTAMMKYAQDIAEKSGAKYLRLTTTEFLHEAVRLYERFGFEECGYDDLYGTKLIRMKKYIGQTSINKKRHEFLPEK
jgi:GNAT superfamily N-acetyltransferase